MHDLLSVRLMNRFLSLFILPQGIMLALFCFVFLQYTLHLIRCKTKTLTRIIHGHKHPCPPQVGTAYEVHE
jgi:hypothetical protein